MVPLLEGRSTACAVKSGSCNGNRGRRSAYLILAIQERACRGNAKSQLDAVMEHLVGRQGQPRGAQVYAMCLSDGSQDPPLPRSHLRVGSGGEGVLLEIPAYLRPSKGQCQLDELPACFLGQLGRTDSRVQCHRCMDCMEMPRVLPNARSCHPALLQASAQQLGAGLHTHLWSPALPKSKSACTCIYQIAGMKKKSSFLLPIFPASERLLRARGGGDVLSPPGLWGGTQAAAWFWLCAVLGRGWQGGHPSSCWKIKEILFCFGMDPSGFEVLGEICWPGQSFSPLSQNFKAAALGCIQGEEFCAAVGKGSPHHTPGPRAGIAQ
ncbi:uncharacterized protein LOC101748689 isoform X2 [Gallus gallus]|uniref:uncharacterized protein LOC101748689 isoform X2 n=1 Tax=Gallus gallus TaxID=9031 RepID=UPI001AEA5F2D|nr:uncharacterized protein LOC101748689 isoform X2 [Gallus gallus]